MSFPTAAKRADRELKAASPWWSGSGCPKESTRFRIIPLVLVSRSSSHLKEVKGWRRFDRETLGRHLRRLGGREPNCAKRESRLSTDPSGQEPRDRGAAGRRQADRSDVRQECVHLRARSGFEPLEKRTGASPSCLNSISRTPAFDPYPFGFAMQGGCGRFQSSALRTSFIQRQITTSDIQTICKEIVSESFFGRTARALIAFAVVRERSGRPRPEPAAARRFLAAEQSRVSAARHISRLQNVCKYAHDAIG
jgi:hypothetical protein